MIYYTLGGGFMKTKGPIEGYMSNDFGMEYEEGKTYHIDGETSFNVRGSGFRVFKNIEDTFRYADSDNPVIAQVTAFGDLDESFDDYNEYYGLYSASDVKVNYVLNREEVIDEVLKKNEFAACRFIVTGYKLTDEEVNRFRTRYHGDRMVSNYIDYYVYKDEDVFKRELQKLLKVRK